MNNRLSKNFTLQEFIYSSTARKYGVNNVPSPQTIRSIGNLVQNVLQPLRDLLGTEIIITSGYRSPELNRIIGGSGTSQHCRGQAADIVVKGYTPRELGDLIRNSGIVYDQIIEEHSGNSHWLHISYTNKYNRMISLEFVNGKYKIIK